ncbi:Uma2 family endonuclease [Spirulina subsalsa]|uniref:Uma2 family endonuclease n=1 Tax=Spirulina subsalsa TaxID=54311 RepID=UPI0002E86F11|nr:Uma2 family endonuclease [Spirulina subsalsa]
MVQTPIPPHILYPDSDGQPMAENTLQYDWIVRLVSNLRRLFVNQQVFVAGDLLWYPVQVDKPPAPAQAPDAMVVFGRPPGYRGSYKQWEEDNIAPQVVFEILSPSNTRSEMLAKQTFYQKHGVLEMFFYDPESYDFWGFVREEEGEDFVLITPLHLPWTSPRLQIRFELGAEGLRIFYPNGEHFKDPGEFMEERDLIQQERDQIQQERDQIQQERDQIQQERDRALAKLRELGIDPDAL